jgi:hypothetical protein
LRFDSTTGPGPSPYTFDEKSCAALVVCSRRFTNTTSAPIWPAATSGPGTLAGGLGRSYTGRIRFPAGPAPVSCSRRPLATASLPCPGSFPVASVRVTFGFETGRARSAGRGRLPRAASRSALPMAFPVLAATRPALRCWRRSPASPARTRAASRIRPRGRLPTLGNAGRAGKTTH